MEDFQWLFRQFFRFLLFASLILSSGVASARTFSFVNNCNYPVWFGFSSGGNSPAPANNNYQLTANGGTNQVTIPANGWSGVIAGRTNCVNGSCDTADCGGGAGACVHGFSQPATQAEFTLNPTGTDFYDVEVINGFNIPISITPSATSQANNPYFCGSPGAASPSAGLGACSWQFAPPLVEYQWVTNGGSACAANSDCNGGNVCGLSFNPGNTPLLKKTCGKLLGYWTADQICGVQRDYGAPFNCSQTVPGQTGLTWWNLYACVNVGSCYSPGAQPNCCGCVNWDQIGISVPASPITQQCRAANPNWTGTVQPSLAWLKQACPTAYTYPFDDMSSTFTCQSMANNNNVVNYTITFCPNGNNTPVPPPSGKCLPPATIQASNTADKKSITLTWQQPSGSDTITTYQVNDWTNKPIWTGTATSFTDTTLPGTNGKFIYFLYSNCPSGQSAGVEEDVTISDNTPPTPPTVCQPPANIKASFTADKKSITLTWQQPANSSPISNYQISDWTNKLMWTGTALSFTDTTLPGTNGKFTYFLYSNCNNGLSKGVQEDVMIN